MSNVTTSSEVKKQICEECDAKTAVCCCEEKNEEILLYMKDVIIRHGNDIIMYAKPTDTIASLKNKIHMMKPGGRKRLNCTGKGLEDERTFADYNIQKESTIYLLSGMFYRKTFNLKFIKTRSADAIQLTNIKFYDEEGSEMSLDCCTCCWVTRGGVTRKAEYSEFEHPRNLVDGKMDSKWLDYNHRKSDDITLTLYFAVKHENTNVKLYELVTGNDCPERDPVSWELYGNSGQLIDRQIDANLPTERCASKSFAFDTIDDIKDKLPAS